VKVHCLGGLDLWGHNYEKETSQYPFQSKLEKPKWLGVQSKKKGRSEQQKKKYGKERSESRAKRPKDQGEKEKKMVCYKDGIREKRKKKR